MSGLFGGGQSTSQVAEKLAGVQIQTSAYGGAVPIVFGTDRVAANLLDYDDFTAIPHTSTQKTGKGGGGSTMSQTTYTYTAMIILAICEGPVTLGRVWRDKEVGSAAGYGFTVFSGDRTQAPWSYLTSKHVAKALGYAGTCLACHAALDLGDSATVKNHSFEVTGFCTIGAGNPGAGDANAADIIPYLLTDAYISPGWSASRIGDLTTLRTYVTAAGFWTSPTLNEQKAAREWLLTILDASNAEAVWAQGSGGMVLKVIPYGDTAITANGATYTPNTTPLYDLGPDDFLVDGPKDKPVKVRRTSLSETFNCIPVEFKDRAIDYNTNLVDDPEPVDVDAFGLRKGETLTLHCIKRASHALQISRIRAQRSVKCRNTYTFRLGWRFALLEPMDLVTITEPKIGFSKVVVRLKSVEEDEKGRLTFEAEEWPFGTASPTAYTSQTGDGAVPNVNADPGNSAAPVIFEPPAVLNSTGQGEIWIGTSGTPNLWGGCQVWVSVDGGSSYTMEGSINQPARHGVTTATFPTGSDPDTTNTLAVDLSTSHGTLAGTDANGRDAFATLSLVGDELVAYQVATLTGTNAYNLTSHRRGAFGSTIAAHSSGARFMRLDDAVLRLPYDDSLKGKTVYLKLVSFNVWGGGMQDLSSVPAYSFTPSGVSYPQPSGVTIAVSDTQPV